MSGPVTIGDVLGSERGEAPEPGDTVDIIPGRGTELGGVAVRRALPKRERRMVGAWCLVDHFTAGKLDMQIGPHPHMGLQTVTWLVEGELVHRDGLGGEQRIRPGGLNLMTAGHGVCHAEESTRHVGGTALHGVQLWVAQPDATRNGPPAFEHHPELPQVELDECVATVLVGALGGVRSPARSDTPLVGVEVVARPGPSTLPLDPAFEHAVVVLAGTVLLGERRAAPGGLAYLGLGRHELSLVVDGRTPARLLVLGGEPFAEPILMWWNFVARSPAELDQARDDWQSGSARFGSIRTRLRRVDAPPRR